MKPLFWEFGGRQKAAFVARPLPDERTMREALASEASGGELRLRVVGLAIVVACAAALVCRSRHIEPLPWPAVVAVAVLAGLYGALKLGQRHRRARLARATDLGAEFRAYRRRLANQLEVATMLAATALLVVIAMVIGPHIDIDVGGERLLLAMGFGAFLAADLLVIERLRRLMRRSRARA